MLGQGRRDHVWVKTLSKISFFLKFSVHHWGCLNKWMWPFLSLRYPILGPKRSKKA